MFPDMDPRATLAAIAPGGSPYWRWTLAQYLANRPGSLVEADEACRAGITFLRDATDSAIGEAKLIFEGESLRRVYLEASVLADRPVDDIAEKVGIGPDVVAAYEQIFFDARVRLNALGWIAKHTFGLRGYFPDDAAVLAWVGYCKGSIMLDVVYSALSNVDCDKYAGEPIEKEEHPKGRVRFAHSAPFHVEIADKPLRPRKEETEFLIRRVEEQLARSKDVLPPAALDEYRDAIRAYTAVKQAAETKK